MLKHEGKGVRQTVKGFLSGAWGVGKVWTRKSHYVAPTPVPTNLESRPIIRPVGERWSFSIFLIYICYLC
jgi:hypothetical protein